MDGGAYAACTSPHTTAALADGTTPGGGGTTPGGGGTKPETKPTDACASRKGAALTTCRPDQRVERKCGKPGQAQHDVRQGRARARQCDAMKRRTKGEKAGQKGCVKRATKIR